jgi:hypothetical protein
MTKTSTLFAAMAALAALSGCGSDSGSDSSNTNTGTPSEQAAVASQSLGMLVDASTESVLATTSGTDSTKAAVPADAEVAPDLNAVAKGITDKVVDLSTFRINGQLVFPSGTTGTITINASGTAATSWPAGITTLYTGSVSVALANIYIPGKDGDSLSIPSGTFSHTLDASGSKTDSFNWTITTDTTATVNPTLTGTVVHAGSSHTVTLGGKRITHQLITRTRTLTDGVVTTNTRNLDRTVSGDVDGMGLSTEPGPQSQKYTSWIVTVDGVKVEWNRYAHLATTWDYNKLGAGNAYTVNDIRDYTFISTTLLGITTHLGAFTAAQWATMLKAKIDAAWL